MNVEETSRNALFPIIHQDLWDQYQQAKSMFWLPSEVSLSTDSADWESMSEDERTFIGNIIAFFAGSDIIVADNLVERFMKEVKITEAKCFYSFQLTMENIHSEMYSILLDTFVVDQTLKSKMLNAVEEIPSIKKKADWARRWIQEGSLGERLLAFIVVEGIFFSGAFCSIFWIKKKGLMNGLCQSNELIMKDEGIHCTFGVLLFSKYLSERPSDSRIHEIVKEAVEIESEFVTDSIPVELIGMNSKLMTQYIQYVADFWLARLSVEPLYNVPNPFDWMALQSMIPKHNFFEKRATNYARGISGTLEMLDDF